MDAVGRPKESWFDIDAGAVVRPYAITYGRTRPATRTFDLISIVLAKPGPPPDHLSLEPESAAILGICQEPMSVAEIGAYLDLPAGTVKVILGDLLARRLIVTRPPARATGQTNVPVLEAVIHGLRSL